jgi:hypothetical protein
MPSPAPSHELVRKGRYVGVRQGTCVTPNWSVILFGLAGFDGQTGETPIWQTKFQPPCLKPFLLQL